MSSPLKIHAWLNVCFFVLPVYGLNAALRIEPAVQLRLETKPGRIYQIERSSNLTQWSVEEELIVGNGSEHFSWHTLHPEGDLFRASPLSLSDLSAELEMWRAEIGVPALSVAVIRQGNLAAFGVVGQRRHGAQAPVTLHDKWHHGSLTKSMTATLAAVLVEEGVINWTTTVGEVFPEKVSAMAGGWSGVTLRHLLSNTSGAPGDLSGGGIWTDLWNFEGLPEAGRELLLDRVTARAPQFAAGEGYEYSNAGFAIAGHMLEKVAGQPWEELMLEKLFRPLGMHGAGFGPPATPRHLDHPVGHSGSASNPTIWDPGRDADNPPAIGPAATVHASIPDMVRYVQLHLRGARGEPTVLLSTGSFTVLHASAFGNDYALGWLALDRPWAGGRTLHHTGSNTQWYTNIWIAPDANWACIVSINFGGTQSFEKTDRIVGYLTSQYGP